MSVAEAVDDQGVLIRQQTEGEVYCQHVSPAYFFMNCLQPTQPVISRFSSHLESLVSSLFLPPPPPLHPMVTETLFTGIPGYLLQKLQNYAARHTFGMLKVVPVAGRVASAP